MLENYAEGCIWFVKLNAAAYGCSAIGKAVRKFQSRLSVHIERRGKINEVTLIQRAGCDSAYALAREFCNEVLAQELRERVVREMAGIRRLLSAQAFARGAQARCA